MRLTVPQPKVYGAQIMEDLDTWIAAMRDYFDLADVPAERRAKILGCFLEGPPMVTYRKADENTRNDIEGMFDLLKAKYGNGTRHYANTTKATSQVQLTD